MRPAVGLLLFYKEKSEENENMKNYKIAVAGTGYVGLSLSVLLAQHNQVTAVDIVQAKVDMINNHKSPIQDDYIEKYLAEKELNLTATLDAKAALMIVGAIYHQIGNTRQKILGLTNRIFPKSSL